MDISLELQQQVQHAIDADTPLNICGGNSKTFLGRSASGEPINIATHSGIVEYDPRELVITALAGTSLSKIEATLAESEQMLAFEPPHYGASATLGGTIACELSGPRRPHAGSARDFVLGCQILNGRGEILNFGGQVMKNVAGYDVSRLMVGAFGTLGMLLKISLKVLPRPAASYTVMQECNATEAIEKMTALRTRSIPVDAACYHAGQCYFRLSSSEQGVQHARTLLSGEELPHAEDFWRKFRDQQLHFFDTKKPLYRIAVKPDTAPLPLDGECLIDWAGAQRWLISDEPLEHIRDVVSASGGHVTVWRGGNRDAVFQPLSAPLLALQQNLKHSFDPNNIFNRQRMYADI
jgi:glycolate oxidase FAD binding subunit